MLATEANTHAEVLDMNVGDGGAARMIEAPDIVLVGSGIMSATLGVMLKQLDPRLRIQMFEVTPELAREASDGWNNAGETFNVTLELVKRGYTEDQIEKIWGGNLLRVMEAVEQYAARGGKRK